VRHRTSVFKVISKRPVILTFECRALGEGAITIGEGAITIAEGAITTYFNVLGLTRPARAGPEITTSPMLRKSIATRPQQSV
jgi:hypothetical protein